MKALKAIVATAVIAFALTTAAMAAAPTASGQGPHAQHGTRHARSRCHPATMAP